MKKLTILIFLLPLLAICQPNKNYLTDSYLRNDSLFIVRNGQIIFSGAVSHQAVGGGALTYFTASKTYLSSTAGTGVINLGLYNIGIGENALDSLNGGQYNIAIGTHAGRSITNSFDNVFLGWDVGYHTRGGSGNFGAVDDALFGNDGGRDNVAIGRGALYTPKGSSYNVSIGYNTGYNLIDGAENTFIGSYAGGLMYRGSYNTFLGGYAGENNFASDQNTYVNFNTIIGYTAGLSHKWNYCTLIGYDVQATGHNQLNVANVIRGYNVTTPSTSTVEVQNDLTVKGNTVTINGVQYNFPSSYPQGTQSMLVNDGFGNLSWQPVQGSITQSSFSQKETIRIFNSAGQFIGYGYK